MDWESGIPGHGGNKERNWGNISIYQVELLDKNIFTPCGRSSDEYVVFCGTEIWAESDGTMAERLRDEKSTSENSEETEL